LRQLVRRSLPTARRAGDLRFALEAAIEQLPPAFRRSAIVIAGRNAMSTPGLLPDLPIDVIGVEVAPGLPPESMLRGVATASGGTYRRATVDQLQARVARFDAERRCADLVHGEVEQIGGRGITEQKRISSFGTALQTDDEIDAEATIEAQRSYADVVLSWTMPEVTVEPYEVIVSDLDNGEVTTFTEEDVERAVGGTQIGNDSTGITLDGGDTQTSVALRLGFQHEDEAAGEAMAARHHRHRVRIGGGTKPRHSAAAAQSGPLYVQFFAPEADPAVSARGPTP